MPQESDVSDSEEEDLKVGPEKSRRAFDVEFNWDHLNDSFPPIDDDDFEEVDGDPFGFEDHFDILNEAYDEMELLRMEYLRLQIEEQRHYNVDIHNYRKLRRYTALISTCIVLGWIVGLGTLLLNNDNWGLFFQIK